MSRSTAIGASSTTHQSLKIGVPIAVVTMIAVMILPLPAIVLDSLISLNIAVSMVILLTVVSIRRPLEFSVLPSVLLLTTVARLGLNIASTRRILLNGADGTDAAGRVIEAFGDFVVGGNMVVGLIVFLVLLAVQFIVINHGANRISEVAARFTLDAMPGKQMAIDADLNAGLIEEQEARHRRAEIQSEADFYGSMDGAVKFTQRDAIASMIIVSINIVGGLIIGILQIGMAPLEAISTYTVLTVGDGLVTAIPALLISISGALVTTRSGSQSELSTDLTRQILTNSRPLRIAAGAIASLGLVPGLPTFAFLSLGGCLGAFSLLLDREKTAADPDHDDETPAPQVIQPEEDVEPLLVVDPLAIEVGYDLVAIAGSEQSGGLLDRIRKIRRQIAQELGIVVPPVRVRDNLNLAPDEYRIQLRGVELGRATLPRRRSLAIDPGDVLEEMPGEPTRDPTFGIPAIWIDENEADRARSLGYTIVDRTSVLATHLTEIVRRHAPELIGRQETQRLIDRISQRAPKLIEELLPEHYTIGQVQKVLHGLLAERVSIRDLETICEVLADAAGQDLNVDALVARVRRVIGRSIVHPLLEEDRLQVVTTTPEFEQEIRALVAPSEGGERLPANPRAVQQLLHRIASAVKGASSGSLQTVLCSDAETRAIVRRLTDSTLPTVSILAIPEIPDGIAVHAVGRVS